jgi:hypothetical protein
MLSELISTTVCLFILWPALLWRFGRNTRPPRPAPRPLRRQVAAVGTFGGRVFAVRLQVILA